MEPENLKIGGLYYLGHKNPDLDFDGKMLEYLFEKRRTRVSLLSNKTITSIMKSFGKQKILAVYLEYCDAEKFRVKALNGAFKFLCCKHVIYLPEPWEPRFKLEPVI